MKQTEVNTHSSAAGSLILVNAGHPFNGQMAEKNLIPVSGLQSGVCMERQAAVLLNRLMSDINGWNRIQAVSGWRSTQEQQEIWDNSLKENGASFTRDYVAVPGCSEHETGLAIDLGLRRETIDFLRPEFPYTGFCTIFRKNAPRYGFIERYPSGKSHITGIAHEPWHFRYVGVPHAQIMTELGLTLEEYHAFLHRYPMGEKPLVYRVGTLEFHISYLPFSTFK